MRAVAYAITLLVSSLAAPPALAQQKKQPPQKASAQTVRYVPLYALLPKLSAEGYMKETRSGANVTSAVFDLCYSTGSNPSRKERLVVPLSVSGGRMSGSGQTQEQKLPADVQLVRKIVGKTVSYDGTIRIGSVDHKASASDNSDFSEDEVRESQATPLEIVASPADFQKMAPGALAARVKREALADVVKILRAENVKVALDSLVADCDALKSGEQDVKLDIDPDRAAALVAKLKGVPGVVAAGWGGGLPANDAVRFAATSWLDGGKADRNKLVPPISAALEKALQAAPQSADWDGATGELTLKFKRSNQSLPGLGLTDNIEVTVLIAPEKPGSPQALVVHLTSAALTIEDEGPTPRLKLQQPILGEDGDSFGTIEMAPLAAALALALNGQVWDADAAAWKN